MDDLDTLELADIIDSLPEARTEDVDTIILDAPENELANNAAAATTEVPTLISEAFPRTWRTAAHCLLSIKAQSDTAWMYIKSVVLAYFDLATSERHGRDVAQRAPLCFYVRMGAVTQSGLSYNRKQIVLGEFINAESASLPHVMVGMLYPTTEHGKDVPVTFNMFAFDKQGTLVTTSPLEANGTEYMTLTRMKYVSKHAAEMNTGRIIRKPATETPTGLNEEVIFQLPAIIAYRICSL